MIEYTKKYLHSKRITSGDKKIKHLYFVRTHIMKYIYWCFRERRGMNGNIMKKIEGRGNITDALKFASYLKNFKENIIDCEIVVKNTQILRNRNKRILI